MDALSVQVFSTQMQQLLSLKATVVTLLDSQFLKIFRKIQRTSVIGGFFSEQNLYGTDIRPGHGQPKSFEDSDGEGCAKPRKS